MKWVPYTRESYVRLGERVLAGVILSAARENGDVRLSQKDTLVYNTLPRPYISGVTLRSLAEQFDFTFIPPLEQTEELDFQERIDLGFRAGLATGIDYLGSVAVVLVRMGRRFAEGAQAAGPAAHILHPRAMLRLLRGWIRSRFEGRPMLPKDLWHVKAIPSGGMGASIYRDRIEHYWGVPPFEQYGSTEAGIVATQTWNKKGMTFFPDAVFLEFVPEEEWVKDRRGEIEIPKTVLLDEVEQGKRYELVITDFFGKPFVRYRTGDIVEFIDLEDYETGVRLPQMMFVGRSSDFIDLGGYSGVLDERLVWQSIIDSGVDFEEWAIRKETVSGRLRLFIETGDERGENAIRQRVNETLKRRSRHYADYEDLIGEIPLVVTILTPGTYEAYMAEKHAEGAEYAHWKPPHMNPTDEEIRLLLAKSAERRRPADAKR